MKLLNLPFKNQWLLWQFSASPWFVSEIIIIYCTSDIIAHIFVRSLMATLVDQPVNHKSTDWLWRPQALSRELARATQSGPFLHWDIFLLGAQTLLF